MEYKGITSRLRIGKYQGWNTSGNWNGYQKNRSFGAVITLITIFLRGVLSGISVMETVVFSDCEIASCSLHDSVRLIRYMWNGMLQGKSLEEGTVQQGNKALNEKRIHSTQKPVVLYDWLLAKYAVPGAKILDIHVGSASSLISCYKNGFSYVGFEKNLQYYSLANKRLEEYKSQITLWDCGLRRN